MVFLLADELLIFDRVAQTLSVLVNAVVDEAASAAEAYENAVGEIERLVSLLEQPTEHHPVTVPTDVPTVPFDSNVSKEKFFLNVRKAKEYITAGDIIRWSVHSVSPPTCRLHRSMSIARRVRSTVSLHVPARADGFPWSVLRGVHVRWGNGR